MNQADPVPETERLSERSTGNDGEACVEKAGGLPCRGGPVAEERPPPDRMTPGPAPVDPPVAAAKPPARRRRNPDAARARVAKPTGRDLVASVLLAVQTAEAFRRRTGHYGCGADYLRLVTAGETRRNLAAGINRSVDLGLIRLELRPVFSKIRRFFAPKCPSIHRKTAANTGA